METMRRTNEPRGLPARGKGSAWYLAGAGLILALCAGLPNPATALPGEAGLAVTVADSVDPALSGTAFTYTVTVTNSGPSTATAATLANVLQDRPHQGVASVQVSLGATIDEATYAAPGGSGECTLDPTKHVVACNLGDLAAGATATAIITVVPQLDSELFNPGEPGYRPAEAQRDIVDRATVVSATPDGNPANNVAEQATRITA